MRALATGRLARTDRWNGRRIGRGLIQKDGFVWSADPSCCRHCASRWRTPGLAIPFVAKDSSGIASAHDPLVAVALVEPWGLAGAIALEECDRAAARRLSAARLPEFGGVCWFAGRIQRRQSGVDVDASSPTQQVESRRWLGDKPAARSASRRSRGSPFRSKGSLFGHTPQGSSRERESGSDCWLHRLMAAITFFPQHAVGATERVAVRAKRRDQRSHTPITRCAR